MMEKRLGKLAERMTAEQAVRFEHSFSDFGDGAQLPKEQTDRILSSVMRKAGYEMNETIQMKKTEKSKTDTHNEHTADVVQLRRGGAIAACLTVAAAGVLAAILLFGQGLNTDDPEQPADPQESIIVTESKIYVPDVAGMEADPARKALEDAGFTPVLRMIYDDNVPAGSVVRTEPAHNENELYDKGTEVQYFVSQGALEIKAEVPDVVGLAADEAADILQSAGLEVACEYIADESSENTVVEQSIEAGTLVIRGTLVTLYVSGGSEELVTPVMITVDAHNILTIKNKKDIDELNMVLDKIKSAMPDFVNTESYEERGGTPGYVLRMNGGFSDKDMYFFNFSQDIPNLRNMNKDYNIPQELFDEMIALIEKHVREAGLKPQSEADE